MTKSAALPTDARAQRSARSWAWTFLASGVCALACFPAKVLFEHFRWFEAPLNILSFGACILAVISAVMYLIRTRGGASSGTTFGLPTRMLALVTILLAGGFSLFCIGVVVMLSLLPSVF
jgi:hypothetical protein